MADDQLIGKDVNGFEILSLIGKGGMSSVYLAKQKSMNRSVALKMLPDQYITRDDAYLQRFEREVKIVAKLEHRNIVPVYDHGKYNDQPYIVMRYMQGGSVDDRIKAGPLSLVDILSIMSQVAPALEYAHNNDVLHRDLKPSNILMDDGGGAFITDFGIARMVGEPHSGITTNGVVGTPAYMSPEQAQGKPLDRRSDVYGLGVMLFEMATGRRPFDSETPYSIAVMQVTQSPPSPRALNPNVTEAVEDVILKALEKQKEKRYHSAADLLAALKEAIENPPLSQDTEPSSPARSEATPATASPVARPAPPSPIQAAPVSASAVAAAVNTYPQPLSGTSRPVTRPPSDLRSRMQRQQKRRHPLFNLLIGGSIGCGLLGLVIALAIFALSFYLPGDAPSVNDSSRTTNPVTAVATTPTIMPTTPVVDGLAVQQALVTAPIAVTPGAPPTPVDPVSEQTAWLSVLRGATGRIVFAGPRGEPGRLQIIVRDVQTGLETVLTDTTHAHNTYPVPSPDGQWIAFQSDRDGDMEIYAMRIDGSDLRQITFNDYEDRLAAWSLDSAFLTYSADVRGDGTYDLRRRSLDVEGTETTIFTNGGRNSHPRYSPDGRFLIFTTGSDPQDARTWEIARLDLQTGEFALLTQNEMRDASAVFAVDGQSVLYIGTVDDSNAIVRMNLDGSEKRLIYNSPANDWAANYNPDGRYIIFTSNLTNSDQLYLMTFDGRNVQQVTTNGGFYATWIP